MEGEPGSSEMIPFGAIVKEPRYAACGTDSQAPVRPPLRPLSTGFRHRFSGIRHRFLSAVRGAQSGDFARFAVNPLTPCFVTGKNFLRMRPGAGNDLSISQRFDHPSPRCNRSSSQCNAPIAHQGRLHPSDQTIRISLSPSGTGFYTLLLTGRWTALGSPSVGSRVDIEAMNRAIALHRVRPVIDRTLPFTQAKAYRHFEDRGHFGKVVIAHA
jgi:hypothetical protein